MKLHRIYAIALVGLIAFAANAATAEAASLLKNIPVTGTLADGGTFDGKLTINELGLDEAGDLVAGGVLKGTVTDATGATQQINTAFEAVVDLLSNGGEPGVCDILNLDIGAIHLDLLGLVIDLSPIELDITAEAGQGKLLGNLLCAVAGLLDQGLDLGLLGDAINALLDAINQLL